MAPPGWRSGALLRSGDFLEGTADDLRHDEDGALLLLDLNAAGVGALGRRDQIGDDAAVALLGADFVAELHFPAGGVDEFPGHDAIPLLSGY